MLSAGLEENRPPESHSALWPNTPLSGHSLLTEDSLQSAASTEPRPIASRSGLDVPPMGPHHLQTATTTKWGTTNSG